MFTSLWISWWNPYSFSFWCQSHTVVTFHCTRIFLQLIKKAMTLRFRSLHPLPWRHILVMLILQELLDIRREVPSDVLFALIFRNSYIPARSTPIRNESWLIIWKFANITETELTLLGASGTADIREPRGTHFWSKFASRRDRVLAVVDLWLILQISLFVDVVWMSDRAVLILWRYQLKVMIPQHLTVNRVIIDHCPHVELPDLNRHWYLILSRYCVQR